LTTRRSSVLRGAALHQANAMATTLERYKPGMAADLFDDPLGALDRHSDVELRLVTESGAGGSCSVAGGYLGSENPPVLVVTESLSRRRRAFTALHEFGHHLQRTDSALGAALLDHRDDELLEEAACHVFASRILLPDALVRDVTPAAGPDALTVDSYFKRSNASRAACCVRAAELLVGGGVVALVRPDGIVDFAASSSTYPPAMGSDQSQTPLLRKALTNPGVTSEHDNTFIAYNTGHSDALYGQAVWVDDYVVMVLKSDNVSWRKFAPPRPGTGSYTSGMDRYPFCEICQDTFMRTTDTCQKCKDPRCPRGHCSCVQARERRCPKCSLTLNRSRFADFPDPTTVCRDCE